MITIPRTTHAQHRTSPARQHQSRASSGYRIADVLANGIQRVSPEGSVLHNLTKVVDFTQSAAVGEGRERERDRHLLESTYVSGDHVQYRPEQRMSFV